MLQVVLADLKLHLAPGPVFKESVFKESRRRFPEASITVMISLMIIHPTPLSPRRRCLGQLHEAREGFVTVGRPPTLPAEKTTKKITAREQPWRA